MVYICISTTVGAEVVLYVTSGVDAVSQRFYVNSNMLNPKKLVVKFQVVPNMPKIADFVEREIAEKAKAYLGF